MINDAMYIRIMEKDSGFRGEMKLFIMMNSWLCYGGIWRCEKISLRTFPGGSDGKESACNAGDPGSIPGSRRSPGVGNGNPLQYSCLKNSTERGAWCATVQGVAKSRTRLSN